MNRKGPFPPSFARTFSSKERRLGTRQPEDYENDEQCLRQSQDSGTVNARGRNLLEACTALNLRILNGLGLLVTWKVKRPAFIITVAVLLITS